MKIVKIVFCIVFLSSGVLAGMECKQNGKPSKSSLPKLYTYKNNLLSEEAKKKAYEHQLMLAREKNKKLEKRIAANRLIYVREMLKNYFHEYEGNEERGVIELMRHMIDIRAGSVLLMDAFSDRYIKQVMYKWMKENSISDKRRDEIITLAQKLSARSEKKEFFKTMQNLGEEYRAPDRCVLLPEVRHNRHKSEIIDQIIPYCDIRKSKHRRVLSNTFFEAAATGDKGLMEQILQTGLSVNATTVDNFTPMHGSILAHNTQSSLFLLDKDASPNIPLPRNGKTPLQMVLENNLWYYQPAFMNFYEKSPLFSLIKRMIEQGADLNILRHADHFSLLHIIAQRLHQLRLYYSGETPRVFDALVRLLLAAGIDPDLRSREGARADQYAYGIGEAKFSENMTTLGEDQKKMVVAYPILRQQHLDPKLMALIVGYLFGFDFDLLAKNVHATAS